MEHQQLTKAKPEHQPQKKQQPSAQSAFPTHGSMSPLLYLQRHLGNEAFGCFIQAKLTVNQPGDIYEQEADRVAEQVMRMPEPTSPQPVSGTPSGIQRKCAACASGGGTCPHCAEEEEMMQRKPLASQITPLIQRQEMEAPEEEEEEIFQAKAAPGATPAVSPAVENHISAMRGGGHPLPPSVRAFFEPRFGYDFSQVRVHADTQAAESARAVNAQAFAVGRDLYFDAGKFEPNSANGRQLLAHELTHTLQQKWIPSIIQRRADPAEFFSAEQIARRLHEAMDGWGTDEEAIYATMSGRTLQQWTDISDAYSRLYHRSLRADLQDELTEEDYHRLSELVPAIEDESALPPNERRAEENRRAAHTAWRLYDAMQGWGTDEEVIFAALTGRTAEEIDNVRTAYVDLFERSLEQDLNDELSGDDLRIALNLLDLAPEETALGFEECDPLVRQQLREYWPIAQDHVARAITALNNGWSAMETERRVIFQRYFDPANTNTIDESFVERVRENFLLIQQYMQTLTFDCNLDNWSICGTGHGWCTDARLYWTCFGNIHVCPYFSTESNDDRKMRDIIHESTHNALHTTDREYYTGDFSRLSPYGSGVLAVAQEVPILGPIFRLIQGNDTLFNPDSYAHFAAEM